MLVTELMPEAANYAEYTEQDLKFAVIGFGKMGILHSGILNMLKPDCVRGVVDRSRFLVFGASRFIKSIRFYRDIGKMLDRENPQVVYVTTPTESHYDIACMLAEAEVKHIFLEKPPAVNFSEHVALTHRINSDQTVMVGLQKRFALPFRHAKMLLSEGVIGNVEEVSAYIKSSDIMAHTARYDSIGRGVLLDLGIHLIDLLEWIFGIDGVETSSYKSIFTNVDDYFEASLEAKGGANVDLEASWCDAMHRLPETCIQIRASQGVLNVTEDCVIVNSMEKHPLLSNDTRLVMYKPHYYQSIPPVNLADPEYTLENIHLMHSIHSHTEPLTSLRNVTKTMEILDQIYRKAGVQNG